jgi:hypothetical protein
MAYSSKDDFPRSLNLQLLDSLIPDFRVPSPSFPSWVPSPSPPKLPDFHLWDMPPPEKPDLRDAPPPPYILPVPPLPSRPESSDPFGEPVRIPPPPKERAPHEVDPSEKNPYNDPDFNPNFFVTKNISEQAGGEPGGGLLGRLLALMQQGQVQPIAEDGTQSPQTPRLVESTQARRPIRSLSTRILSDQSDDQ